MPSSDLRLHAPAAARNRGPIQSVLSRVLPDQGRVLEIASGSGEHIVSFAERWPDLIWQPSEPDPRNRASIAAYRAAANLENLQEPLDIDVTGSHELRDEFDAVICINMIHIAPWAATIGLFQSAERWLAPGGLLYLYGPFRRAGQHTAPSNAAFDQSLQAQDPSWGIRDLDELADLAKEHVLSGPKFTEMPANNLSVWFEKP